MRRVKMKIVWRLRAARLTVETNPMGAGDQRARGPGWTV